MEFEGVYTGTYQAQHCTRHPPSEIPCGIHAVASSSLPSKNHHSSITHAELTIIVVAFTSPKRTPHALVILFVVCYLVRDVYTLKFTIRQ